jgi:hypothetical protein
MLTAEEKLVLAKHRMHGTLVRWLYRILAPRHPRGWLDFHALTDPRDPGLLCSVHCHGMARWGLPNLEIVDVPAELGGFAHGILFDITGYMKSTRVIQAGETFGGMLVSRDQIVPHLCSLVAARLEDEPLEKDFLRVVDLNAGPDGRFPARLFAAHLLALAEKERHADKRTWMLRRSVAIFPGENNAGPEDEGAARDNPGNFFSWYTLGDALCDTGHEDEGLRCLQTAAERWPFGARKNAQAIVDGIKAGQIPLPDKDRRSRFWSDLARS